MTRSHRISRAAVRLAVLAVALAPLATVATDGSPAPPSGSSDGGGETLLSASSTETYYESAVGTDSARSLETNDPTLPTTLVVDDATAVTSYRATAETATGTEWQLRIDGFERRHERVDGIYDMVLVLALPTANGRDAFDTSRRGFFVEEGGAQASVPLIYGGEKVVLKRNVGLEKSLLRQLIGPNGLPDLAGTGYRWTAWDTIMKRDSAHEDVVQARGHLEYTTASGVAAPDPADGRMAAYLITWIPGLPGQIPPFSVRMDVVPSQ
jgi:hypothetical protein